MLSYFPKACEDAVSSVACVSSVSTTVWSQRATSPAGVRENVTQKGREGPRKKEKRGGGETAYSRLAKQEIAWLEACADPPDSRAMTDRPQQIQRRRREQRGKDLHVLHVQHLHAVDARLEMMYSRMWGVKSQVRCSNFDPAKSSDLHLFSFTRVFFPRVSCLAVWKAS